MIYISFMDLMPEAIMHVGFTAANVWFFGGMVFFAAVINFVPEPEVEDLATGGKKKKSNGGGSNSGNAGGKKNLRKRNVNSNNNNKKANTNNETEEIQQDSKYLLMVGIVTAIGISLHNFPEGVAVFLACLKGPQVGLPLALAIAA